MLELRNGPVSAHAKMPFRNWTSLAHLLTWLLLLCLSCLGWGIQHCRLGRGCSLHAHKASSAPAVSPQAVGYYAAIHTLQTSFDAIIQTLVPYSANRKGCLTTVQPLLVLRSTVRKVLFVRRLLRGQPAWNVALRRSPGTYSPAGTSEMMPPNSAPASNSTFRQQHKIGCDKGNHQTIQQQQQASKQRN